MVKRIIIICLFAILLSIGGCAPQGEVPVAGPMPSILVVEEIEGSAEPSPKPASSEPDTGIEQIYNEYAISLSVNPETGIITGNQRVSYINKTGRELNEICFNVPLNAFAMESPVQPYFSDFRANIFPAERDYGYMNITGAMSGGIEARYDIESCELSVYLDTPLAAGKKCDVSIQFEAYVPKMNHRTGSNQHAMWMGAFLPTLCVFEDGGFRFDSYYPAGDPFYTEVANYSVNITAPSTYKVVATGVESVKEDDKVNTSSFSAKLVRDFTFAILDGSYKKTSKKTAGGVDINFYSRSTYGNLDSFLSNAVVACEFFSNYVGAYPYSKIDVVEAGLFFGSGAEFSQVIFMDANYMLKPEALRTMIHEIGHQWFYNIIGSDQINSPWQDEGLVCMIQEKIYFPELLDFQAKFEADYNTLSERLPNLPSLNLSANISEYKDWTNYHNIQYTKGKLMVYSLNMKMGEEKFSEFIKEYYARYSYKIAKQEDFINLAEEIYGESLEEFFDNWLNEDALPPLYN